MAMLTSAVFAGTPRSRFIMPWTDGGESELWRLRMQLRSLSLREVRRPSWEGMASWGIRVLRQGAEVSITQFSLYIAIWGLKELARHQRKFPNETTGE
jgi:hypothetical protein